MNSPSHNREKPLLLSVTQCVLRLACKPHCWILLPRLELISVQLNLKALFQFRYDWLSEPEYDELVSMSANSMRVPFFSIFSSYLSTKAWISKSVCGFCRVIILVHSLWKITENRLATARRRRRRRSAKWYKSPNYAELQKFDYKVCVSVWRVQSSAQFIWITASNNS